ncbi:HK97 family phage prohead protease [Myxococcus sp. AB036A]|uniref:HK97 family phage prohead protease n=1 Tax=Myxococcus sp. AB036A TaxID=2562793 RepID=UPI00114619C1|nr:HK97 family phage prohead protease [Myxococcus sp. AB036A]
MKTFRKLLESTPAGGGAPPVFRITSTNLDRHQDRVLAIKSVGDELRVPLLWQHDRWGPGIGVARCFREAGNWVMEPLFDEVDELSRTIAAKVKAGTLSACSIGFRPSPEAEPVPNKEGGYDFPLVDLLEVSIVNIPANQDAMRVRSFEGEDSPSSQDAWKAYRQAQTSFRTKVEASIEQLKADLKRLLKIAEEEEDKEDEEETASDDDDETASEEEDEEDKEEDEEDKEEDEEDKEEDEEDKEEDEETTSDDDDETASAEEDDEDLDEEEAKKLRATLVKGGFTLAQAKALAPRDLRGMARLMRRP